MTKITFIPYILLILPMAISIHGMDNPSISNDPCIEKTLEVLRQSQPYLTDTSINAEWKTKIKQQISHKIIAIATLNPTIPPNKLYSIEIAQSLETLLKKVQNSSSINSNSIAQPLIQTIQQTLLSIRESEQSYQMNKRIVKKKSSSGKKCLKLCLVPIQLGVAAFTLFIAYSILDSLRDPSTYND